MAPSPPVTLGEARDGTGESPQWEMRRERMSPQYTTRLDEVAAVRC